MAACLLAARPAAAGPIEQALAMGGSSLVVGSPPWTLISHRAQAPMIPASTMKLVTALAAIERWGLAHRFTTEFLIDDQRRLWVRGAGDPYLVSEELDLIARALREQGLQEVSGLGLDDRLYPEHLRIPGRSRTNNPYDAPVTALAVNFNTVNLSITAQGVGTGEAQTPLTATGRRLAAGLGPGKHRLNLGSRQDALAHFGELFTAKLRAADVQVSGPVIVGAAPRHAKVLYRHTNSRSLDRILRDMLEYSNNFVANNLFLLLGIQGDPTAAQASFAQSQQLMEAWARRRFQWQDFRLEDGAGLSRGNRLSGAQLIDVLDALADHRHLLPTQDGEARVKAKTGTLSGVSCYAGFVERGSGWIPFSLMINQAAPYNFRLQLAKALADAPRLP